MFLVLEEVSAWLWEFYFMITGRWTKDQFCTEDVINGKTSVPISPKVSLWLPPASPGRFCVEQYLILLDILRNDRRVLRRAVSNQAPFTPLRSENLASNSIRL